MADDRPKGEPVAYGGSTYNPSPKKGAKGTKLDRNAGAKKAVKKRRADPGRRSTGGRKVRAGSTGYRMKSQNRR